MSSRLFLATLLLLVLGFAQTAPSGQRQAVRIMPLGDSITWDITFGDTRPDGLRTGYRQPLYLALQAEGFDVDFVGSLQAGQDAVPAFDPDNEGHSGWTDAQIAANIYNWLAANPADVILLHIGTNGLDPSPNDVAAILNEVDRYEGDHDIVITVFIARIIQRVPYSGTTTQFNDNVEAMALARVAGQGDRIVMVDMEDGAGLIYQIDTSALVGDMYDYLHPNSKGYPKMAAQWFSALRPFLASGNCPVGLAHYWPLDESGGAPYNDVVGGADATCSGCPAPTSGIVSGALEFETSDEVSIAAESSLDWSANDDFTIEFWCRPSAIGIAQALIGRQGNGAFDAWSIRLNESGAPVLHLQDVGQSFDLVSPVTLTSGAWNHVAATRDGASGSTSIYVNGSTAATGAISFSSGFTSSHPLTLGYLETASSGPFAGTLDEVALYDSALSSTAIAAHEFAGRGGIGICGGTPNAAEIISTPGLSGFVGSHYSYDAAATGNPTPHYSLLSAPFGLTLDSISGVISWTPSIAGNFGVILRAANYFGADTQSFTINVTQLPSCPSNLLHYWTLDELSGSSYTDQMGSTSATCSSCPTAVPGKINVAKDFDRIDDAVSVNNDGSYNWGTASSFSIEFWMNQGTGCAGASQPNNEVIVGRAGAGWWIGIMCEPGGNSGKLRCYFQGTDIYSTQVVSDGEWHHIVFVRDNSAGRWRLYVDGSLDQSVSGSGHSFVASDPLSLGWFNGPDPGKYRFAGVLDELALYDGVLSEGTVTMHYNAGLGTSYCFDCGDVDANRIVSISDAVYLISFIFGGGPPPVSMAAADADCNGFITISDAVYLIGYIFGGGPGPCQSCK